jgi:hypothetical protein
VGALAIFAITLSGLTRVQGELARRRAHTPVLKRFREVRDVASTLPLGRAIDLVEQELRRDGFQVERVETSHGARVVIARRGGWAFGGTMLVHAGLLVALAAAASAPVPEHGNVLAMAAAAVASGAWLRLAFDPQVAWCAAQGRDDGSALELVVSGCLFRGRLAQTADRIAAEVARAR